MFASLSSVKLVGQYFIISSIAHFMNRNLGSAALQIWAQEDIF